MPWQKTTWENATKSNILLSISNLVLAIIVLVSVFHDIMSKDDTVLVPGIVDEKMVISMNSANEAYMKSFGLYAATLIANITSSNADFVVEAISQFIDASVYPDIRKKILATATMNSFKEAAAATKYVARQVIYEPDTSKVFVVGDSAIITTVGASAPRTLIYEMTIHIVNKRPVILALDTYEGAQPHIKQWVTEHTAQNGELPNSNSNNGNGEPQ